MFYISKYNDRSNTYYITDTADNVTVKASEKQLVNYCKNNTSEEDFVYGFYLSKDGKPNFVCEITDLNQSIDLYTLGCKVINTFHYFSDGLEESIIRTGAYFATVREDESFTLREKGTRKLLAGFKKIDELHWVDLRDKSKIYNNNMLAFVLDSIINLYKQKNIKYVFY